MSVSFDWAVSSMTRTNDSDKAVTRVQYVVTATGYGKSTVIPLSYNYEADPSSESYVPFADLTEAGVIQWAKDRIGTEGLANMEAAVTPYLQSTDPVVVNGKGEDFPWTPPEEE